MAYKKGVTMIDDLMDLNDSEPDTSFTQKFIRDTSNKGMGKYEEDNTSMMNGIPPYQPKQTNYHPRPAPQMSMGMQQPNRMMMQQPEQQIQMMTPSTIIEQPRFDAMEEIRIDCKNLRCVDIVNHIKDCPVCGKLYNNNEKTVYIVIIIILVLLVGLLLKKLFEK